ncbi:MAG: hypothetical protein ACRD8O_17205 [Bryobacteraceae bacterium]
MTDFRSVTEQVLLQLISVAVVVHATGCGEPSRSVASTETPQPVLTRAELVANWRAEARALAKIHNEFLRYAAGTTDIVALRAKCREFYGLRNLDIAGCDAPVPVVDRRRSAASADQTAIA